MDKNKDRLLSKQEIRDWIGSCPSIYTKDRDPLFHAIVRADADLDGVITVDELMGLMDRSMAELGGTVNDPVPCRQLVSDKIMWGLIAYTVATVAWFLTACLRVFTVAEDQRALQYTTAVCWMAGAVAFFMIDMQAFANEAKRASITYQRVLADARGIVLKQQDHISLTIDVGPDSLLLQPRGA